MSGLSAPTRVAIFVATCMIFSMLAHVKSECKCQEICYTLGMDFPILDLVDDELATDWLLKHFHPHGLKCPHCGAGVMEARPFRQTATSQLTVHRCLQCQGITTFTVQPYFNRSNSDRLKRCFCFAASAKGRVRLKLLVRLASLDRQYCRYAESYRLTHKRLDHKPP